MAAGVRVELLRVEAERRRDPEQLVHQVARVLELADDRERRDEPERADQERALLPGEAVVGLVGAVAEHEAVLGQLLGDRVHGRVQALVVAGEEAEDRGQEHRGIERVGLVVLAQDPPFGDAVLEDVRADLVGRRTPRGRLLGVASDLGELRCAVERDPAHQLRRDVVLRRAPGLPDALVRLPPHLRSRTRPATGRSATAVWGAVRCGACGAGSSRARRRRRRSGAGRRRRSRSGPGARRRSPRGGRASTR